MADSESPKPPVSVVVPTFRRPAALRACIRSLSAQDYPHDLLDVVIVDDGGGVSASDLAGEATDLRLRLVSQPKRGPAAARNRGAREGIGALLAFTDDDCRPTPSWVAEIAAGLAREPRALAGGRVVNGLVSNRFAEASQDLLGFLYEYFPHGRALRPFFTANNIACRRDAFLELGGFDESFPFSAAEDRDLSERWPAIGPLVYLPGAVVEHHHDLTLGRFLRQHHYYGRGAVHLARCRRNRGGGRPRPEPLSFYRKMLGYPIRRHGWIAGGPIAVLVGLSQLSGLTGMLRETLHRSHPHDPTPAGGGR
jgi:GT2 family glycosyltransferase